VSWIAHRLASDTPNPWKSRLNKAVPLPFVLRDLDIGQGFTWDGLVDAFLAVSAHHLLSKEQVTRLLEDGSAILLLDGLDEIGDRTARQRLRRAVQEGIRRYPNCRWLLTSRIAGYDEVPFHLTEKAEVARRNDKLAIVEELLDVRYVVPFDDARIEEFARTWYDIRERGVDKAPVVEQKTRALVEAVQRDGDSMRLARIPYLLTMMALVHRVEAVLPYRKALLYDQVAEALLESIDLIRHRLLDDPNHLQDKKRWLGEVAFRMMRSHCPFFKERDGQSNAIIAARATILDWLRSAMEESGEPLDPDDPARFLERVLKRSGLMIERAKDQFSFNHLSFQDYFAALHLQKSVASPEWVEGESTAAKNAGHSREKLHQRFHWFMVNSEPYAGQVASGTSSEYLRQYAYEWAWHATLVLMFELIADGGWLQRKLVREAIFGPGWELGGDNPYGAAVPMALLARLAANPHVKWETEIEAAAIDRCVTWAMEMGGGIYGAVENRLPFRILLNGEPEKVRARLERIVHHRGAIVPSAGRLCGLDLSKTGVTDLVPLSKLTGLRVLQLEESDVVDLRPLAGLTQLLELDVSQTRVTDITAVAGLTNLRLLWLYETGVTDVSPIVGLTKLEYLSLADTRVTDLAPLAKLTKLERLDLQFTHVSNDEVEMLQAKLPALSINR
jgi:hypothetical protein